MTEIHPAEVDTRQRTWPTWIEIILCSGYPTQLAIGGALQAAGLNALRPDGSLSSAFVFTLSLLDTVVLLTLILWLLTRRGEAPGRVFFGERPLGHEAVTGLLSVPFVFVLVAILTIAIRQFAPTLRNVPDNPLEALLGTQTGLLMFLFVVIVAGGVREELQRAFLLHRFREDLGQPWMGVLITSLAFGMGHTLQGLDAAIITGSLGALWGVMYIGRRSAMAPIVSHSLFNSAELLRVFFR
ncbi:MAG TPA: CPBP family intramembrane glutamic endopeptidase [Vicinamibacterales bacterium]|nr:CPBP family intramembrane glutamic endopeptidase [Vicinamibacterales bacterium]